MRKKNFKGRCEKRVLGKCAEVCRTYDPIQYAYADLLQASDEVVEIKCNVLLDGLEVGEYTSNFVCTKTDSDLMVREFAPAVGVGMLDATVCDIYLVNDTGSLVGRPILTACIDANSGLYCGYSLSWEGGVYSSQRIIESFPYTEDMIVAQVKPYAPQIWNW